MCFMREIATKEATTSCASNDIVRCCGVVGQQNLSDLDLLVVWPEARANCTSTTAQKCETMDELAAKLQSWATNGVDPGAADYVAML